MGLRLEAVRFSRFAKAAGFIGLTALSACKKATSERTVQSASPSVPTVAAPLTASAAPLETAAPVATATAPSAGVAGVNISEAIVKAGSKPTGYKGAEGKVVIENGAIKTTADIEGTDAGFFVSFPAVDIKGAQNLELYTKANIFQKQGWDHYSSIQLKDENGKRYIVLELCREGQYGNCAGKPVTSSGSVRQGTTLKIKLPAGLDTLERFEVVFIGDTKVAAGAVFEKIIVK